jgi:PilZ domain
MTLAVERRAADRHEIVSDRTSVQVMDWLGPRIRQARLVNISTSGALIETDQLPALHQPIRVRLEIAKEVGWFSAIPVRFGRSNEVGIHFVRPLPLYFLPKSTPESDSPVPAKSGVESR